MAEFITPIKPMSLDSFDKPKSTGGSTGLPFQKMLGEAMDNMESASKMGSKDGFDLAMGNVEDLAQIQINSLKAQAMMQTTVQLTSRIANAYKEIMQMQI